MAIQLGRWDCPVCGQKANLGNQLSCPSCGAPRGKDVDFYLPEDAEDIADENLLKEANAGVDWRCDYCGADNKATAIQCKSCGNERSKEDTDRQISDYDTADVPRSGEKKKTQKEIPVSTKTNSGSPAKKLIIVAGIIILIIAFVFWPRSFKVEVIKHTWERSIEIENNRLVTEEEWNLPAGGTLKTSFRAIHHYNKVLDHYETRTRTVQVKVGSEQYECGQINKGNGYFEDKYCTRDIYDSKPESYQQPIYLDVPVYGTKYRYTIYRWIKDHQINDKGSDKSAKWPVEQFKSDTWREGKKTEKYMLFYQDNKGRQYNEVVDYNLWEKINDNQQLEAKKNSMNVFYGINKEKL